MYWSNTTQDQSQSRSRQHIRKNYNDFMMKESSHLFMNIQSGPTA